MSIISKVIILAIAAIIAIACALGFLFFFKSDSNSKQNPENTPEYYQEGPLRSYNFCGPRKVISLTFDDGPDVMKTPNVLRDLKRAKVKGTFFMSPAAAGEPTAGQCKLVEKVLSEGHSVQSHSWNHANFKNMTNEEVMANLGRNREWLESCAGSQRDRLTLTQFRPPYGALDKGQAEFISNIGYTIAGWNIDSKDFEGGVRGGSSALVGGTRNSVFQKIVGDFRRVVPSDSSATILMHDKHYDAAGTQGLIEMLVPYFENLGYKFATADTCFSGCNEYVSICEDKNVWPRWATE